MPLMLADSTPRRGGFSWTHSGPAPADATTALAAVARQLGEQDFQTPARDLAERRRPGVYHPIPILRDPVRGGEQIRTG
jgi:hypothetical protein